MFRNEHKYVITKKGSKVKVHYKLGPFKVRVKTFPDKGQAVMWKAKRCCKARKCFFCKGEIEGGCRFCTRPEA